ncbi:MAG: hypothetical protein RL687_393 [Candidatus Parcubacteria bacterium]
MTEVINFFTEYKQVSIIAHVFFVILGMGSALVSDILFNFYIKDKKINPTENSTLEVLSGVIWISVWFIILSGGALFLSDIPTYSVSAKFLLKMTIVGFIIINGYLFARITHGALSKLNFSDLNSHHKYVRIRRMSFAFGAVSLVSWLSSFVLGSVSNIHVSFWSGLIIYGVIVSIAVSGSQVVEFLITRKNK